MERFDKSRAKVCICHARCERAPKNVRGRVMFIVGQFPESCKESSILDHRHARDDSPPAMSVEANAITAAE